MAVIHCTKCFRKREEARSQPIPDMKICGACAMDVDSVVGWLEFNHYQLQRTFPEVVEGQGDVDPATGEIKATGDEPPKPPTKAEKAALDKANEAEAIAAGETG